MTYLYQLEADAIVADQRAVERDLEVAAAGGPESTNLRAELARLADEFHRLAAEAFMHRRPLDLSPTSEG